MTVVAGQVVPDSTHVLGLIGGKIDLVHVPPGVEVKPGAHGVQEVDPIVEVD